MTVIVSIPSRTGLPSDGGANSGLGLCRFQFLLEQDCLRTCPGPSCAIPPTFQFLLEQDCLRTPARHRVVACEGFNSFSNRTAFGRYGLWCSSRVPRFNSFSNRTAFGLRRGFEDYKTYVSIPSRTGLPSDFDAGPEGGERVFQFLLEQDCLRTHPLSFSPLFQCLARALPKNFRGEKV